MLFRSFPNLLEVQYSPILLEVLCSPNLLGVQHSGLLQCGSRGCDVECRRKQELERHRLTHLPCWIHCPSLDCPWRGDRSDAFRRHWVVNHNDEGPVPVRKEFEIYNPTHLLQSVKEDVLTLDEAAEYACAMVEEKALKIGKEDIWRDLWGRRSRPQQ